MASFNKVTLIGNLGRDPETRFMPSGDAIANIAVATTDKWKDKATGEQKEATEWHRVAFFGKLAEIAGRYLKKGSQVYIEGKLRTRKYTDKDGVEKFSTEITADTMIMLGGKSDGQQSQQPAAQQRNAYADARGQAQPQQQRASQHPDMDDDIPF